MENQPLQVIQFFAGIALALMGVGGALMLTFAFMDDGRAPQWAVRFQRWRLRRIAIRLTQKHKVQLCFTHKSAQLRGGNPNCMKTILLKAKFHSTLAWLKRNDKEHPEYSTN